MKNRQTNLVQLRQNRNVSTTVVVPVPTSSMTQGLVSPNHSVQNEALLTNKTFLDEDAKDGEVIPIQKKTRFLSVTNETNNLASEIETLSNEQVVAETSFSVVSGHPAAIGEDMNEDEILVVQNAVQNVVQNVVQTELINVVVTLVSQEPVRCISTALVEPQHQEDTKTSKSLTR